MNIGTCREQGDVMHVYGTCMTNRNLADAAKIFIIKTRKRSRQDGKCGAADRE